MTGDISLTAKFLYWVGNIRRTVIMWYGVIQDYFSGKRRSTDQGDCLSQSGSHYRGIAISKPVDNHFYMVTVQPIEGYEMSKLYGNVLRNGIGGTSSITTAITSCTAKLDIFDTTVNAAPAGTLMAILPHVGILGTMVAVYVDLLPVRSPTVALETLISLTVKPVTAISKKVKEPQREPWHLLLWGRNTTCAYIVHAHMA